MAEKQALTTVDAVENALVKAVKDVERHKQEVEELLPRYQAVDDVYEKKVESLTTEISSVHTRQQSVSSQRANEESQLQREKSELSQLEGNLQSARRKLDEAESQRNTRKAVAVGAGALTVLTFGLAAPLTFAAGAATIGFAAAATDAKMDMSRAQSDIDSVKSKIRSSESTRDSLTNSITQLNIEHQNLESKKTSLHSEVGKVKKVIAFLLDAQKYAKIYKEAIDALESEAEQVKDLMDIAEKKEYSLFDSEGTELILSSFQEAWTTFREMKEKGQEYVFKVEFDCSQCGRHCDEFPRVNSSGQFVCDACFLG